MANFAEAPVRSCLKAVFSHNADIQLGHPFGRLCGPEALYDTAYAPLFAALPDLERREMIVMAGTTPEGQDWVGIMGNYMGSFLAPWLDIPPTGHLIHMRFHEFYRLEEGKVTEMQAIWDIPEADGTAAWGVSIYPRADDPRRAKPVGRWPGGDETCCRHADRSMPPSGRGRTGDHAA
jgi:hypothetical protein